MTNSMRNIVVRDEEFHSKYWNKNVACCNQIGPITPLFVIFYFAILYVHFIPLGMR